MAVSIMWLMSSGRVICTLVGGVAEWLDPVLSGVEHALALAHQAYTAGGVSCASAGSRGIRRVVEKTDAGILCGRVSCAEKPHGLDNRGVVRL